VATLPNPGSWREKQVTMSDDVQNLASARHLLNSCNHASLATLGEDDMPFASLVTLSADAGRQPILLLSQLAVHTRNLDKRPQASLLLVQDGSTAADPLVRERLTVSGYVRACQDQGAASAIFLRDHPHAAGYAGFADFSFYAMACTSAHLVAGFGRIASFSADQLFFK